MSTLKVIGSPFNFGQIHAGVANSYTVLKNKQIFERLNSFFNVEELGLIHFPFSGTSPKINGVKNYQHCHLASEIIYHNIKDIDLKDGFLLHIGGDHGVGLGSVCGILEHNPNTIVIWADAHADINHPVSSPSGHFHGMPLAFLTGIAKNQDFSWIKNYLPFENLILLGPRDLDPFEKELIHQCGINYISPFEVANEGINHSIQRCLNKVDPYGLKSIHLSFDVDLIDPKYFSSTGTPVYGGPNEFEIIELGKIIAKTGRLKSLDIVEFNPELGDLENSIEVLYHFIQSTVSEAIQYQNVHQQIIHHFENQYRVKTDRLMNS